MNTDADEPKDADEPVGASEDDAYLPPTFQQYGDEYAYILEDHYCQWKPNSHKVEIMHVTAVFAYMFPPQNDQLLPMNPLHIAIGSKQEYKEQDFLDFIVKPNTNAENFDVSYCRLDADGFLDRSSCTLSREKATKLLTEQLTEAGLIMLFTFLDVPSIEVGTQIRLPLPLWKVWLETREVVSCRRLPGIYRVKLPGADLYRDERLYVGRDNTGNSTLLSGKWFEDNIEDLFQQNRLDFLATQGNYSWNKVNPGKRLGRQGKCNGLNPEFSTIEPTFLPNVKVSYRQFDGDRLCYLNSLCSALNEFGMRTESRTIHELGCEKTSTHNTNDFVHRIVEKQFRGSYQFKRLRDKKKRFDPLRSRCKYPTVVKLKQKGSDAYPHCVTFYKNMIFDSSFKNALKKNRNNLDYICGGRGKYVGVWWSKQLQPVEGNKK